MISALTEAMQQVVGNEAWLLPVAYGMVAAIAFAGGWFLGGFVLGTFKQTLRQGGSRGRIVCAASVLAAVIIWSGLYSGVLTRGASAGSHTLEPGLIATLLSAPGLALSSAAQAESEPALPGPPGAQLGTQQCAVKDRTFEIDFVGSGVRAYVFTFG